jgi:translation initiation factor IF-2
MAKIRVYELARELNLESKALVVKINDMGIEVSSHQSTLTAAQATKIKETLGGGKASKPKVVVRRRKKKAEEEAVEAAGTDTEESTDSSEEVEEAAPKTVTRKRVAAKQEVEPTEEANEEQEAPIVEAKTEAKKEKPSIKEKVAAVEANEEESGEDGRKLSKATQALMSARSKEKKSDRSFESAKIVRKSEPSKKPSGDSGRYSLKSGSEKGADNSQYDSQSASTSGSTFKGRTTEKKKTGYETEPEKPRTPVKKDKRSHVTTRDLLSNYGSDESEPSVRRGKKRTVYTPSGGRRKDFKRRKDLKKTEITVPKASLRVVTLEDTTMTVGELAKQLSVKAGDIIKKLMASGEMVTINQSLDEDTVTLISVEYGYEVKSNVKSVDDLLGKTETSKTDLVERSPIVTIMGHVDHGKTSILDAIREAEVASGEAGGITQHIGAYTVTKNGKKVAFLDTPGHAAFSSMRARGAKVTDICIIVVAADDGVMPQTVEAISHAKSADVPIIVAVNKMDKPNINLDRVYTELAEHGIQSEDWGGEHQFVKVSALQKTGLDDLIDAIQLQAEILELKASEKGAACGSIIEAHLDKGRGPVATVMVTEGTLRKGDVIVAGQVTGRVRAMADHNGKSLETAGPATPVEVIGLTGVPMAGDQVDAVKDDKLANMVSEKRAETLAKERSALSSKASLEDLLAKVASDQIPEVPFIVKADTQGSAEAICEALLKIESEKIKCRIIHKGVGGINNSDLTLAETSGAVVFGFNVRAARGLSDDAESRGVTMKYFSIIYELIDAAKAIMQGSLPPIESEIVLGHAEIRSAISVPKVGTIAGSAVLDGKIVRNCHLRLIRDDVVIHSGKIGSLRRFKDDVKEVNSGYECGIGIEGYNDLKIGDVIEAFTIEKSEATL